LSAAEATLTTNLPPACSISFRPVPGAARSHAAGLFHDPSTTINGKDHTMTLEQSIDLAELQADMAFDAYLAAFDEDAHPETLDSLETEALIARSRYDDLRNQGLGQ
jgi:Cu/Zn superoxide dismutase